MGGLHECFDEVYQKVIMDYLNNFRKKYCSDSDAETDDPNGDEEDAKSHIESKNNNEIEQKGNEFVDSDNFVTDKKDKFKIILSATKKCCLLYNQNKNDEYIAKKVKNI